MELFENFTVVETPIPGSFDRHFKITCQITGIAREYRARDEKMALDAVRHDSYFDRLSAHCAELEKR